MVRKMDFKALDELANEVGEKRAQRWARQPVDPVVQMSFRMKASIYDRFKALCAQERHTNGNMLEILLDSYLERMREEAKKR